MRANRRLTVLALVASMMAGFGAAASPATADDTRSDPVVLSRLAPGATLEEMHEQAGQIRRQRLPVQVSRLTVVQSPSELTADQISAIAAGTQAEGARWLGEVRQPSPGTTLEQVGRQIGWGDVIWWKCYQVYLIIGGQLYVIWVCVPIVLRA